MTMTWGIYTEKYPFALYGKSVVMSRLWLYTGLQAKKEISVWIKTDNYVGVIPYHVPWLYMTLQYMRFRTALNIS